MTKAAPRRVGVRSRFRSLIQAFKRFVVAETVLVDESGDALITEDDRSVAP